MTSDNPRMELRKEIKDAFDPTPSRAYGQRVLFTGPDGIFWGWWNFIFSKKKLETDFLGRNL